jgi:hypothetical protein
MQKMVTLMTDSLSATASKNMALRFDMKKIQETPLELDVSDFFSASAGNHVGANLEEKAV